MDVMNLMHELAERGIRLERRGDKLRVIPKSALTPELIEQVRDRKAELLEALDSPREAYATSDGDDRPTYSPGDDPLPSTDNPDELSMDLLILSYACGRRARMLRELGDCPSDIAEQIRHNLEPVESVI